MANEEGMDELLKRLDEESGRYQDCERIRGGHRWVRKTEWFLWGWRWPWRTTRWTRCTGCGWATFLSSAQSPWPRYRP